MKDNGTIRKIKNRRISTSIMWKYEMLKSWIVLHKEIMSRILKIKEMTKNFFGINREKVSVEQIRKIFRKWLDIGTIGMW